MRPVEAPARFVFCFGQYAPLGPVSVAAEWRDYILGLDALGAEVQVIDLCSLDNLPRWIGPLSIAAAACRRAPALLDRASRLEAFDLPRITRQLDDWLALGREGAESPDRYPAELARLLPHETAVRIRSAVILGWRQAQALARLRQTSPRDCVSGEDRVRLERILARSEGLAEAGPAPTAVVDFYDLARWGGATLRCAFESAIRNRGYRGPIRWVVRAITECTVADPLAFGELKYFDEVWVPAAFHLPIFAASEKQGLVVRKIPEALDAELFKPPRSRRRLPGARRCAFLILSHYLIHSTRLGLWNEVRKATDVAIRAFLAEFSADEDVSLVLKGAAQEEAMEERLRTFLEQEGEPPRRRDQFLIVGKVRQQRLPHLYASVDALLGAARGEGWGRPLAEAMASGTAAVGSRFGGNLEFMRDEHTYLVDCEIVPIGDRFAENHNSPEGHWAEPSRAHLQRILREIFTDPRAARAKGRAASAFVRERYHRTEVARLMLAEAREAGR